MAGGDHDSTADSTTGRIPFWIHQVVEVLLGMVLLLEGARNAQHTAVLVALGALVLLLALSSDGALGVWAWIGRRLHRVLDLVVAAVLALSPLALGLDHVLAIVILEATAAGMAWLAFRTDWHPRSKPRAASKSPRDATLSETAKPRPVPTGDSVARKAGRAVGKARDDAPRKLGRLAGRAQRAARKAMAPSGPPPEPPAPAG
jgi:hypothetical protein